jgi:hypothetical protein
MMNKNDHYDHDNNDDDIDDANYQCNKNSNNFISSVCLVVLHFFFVLSKAPEATLCGFAAAVCTPAPGGDFL